VREKSEKKSKRGQIAKITQTPIPQFAQFLLGSKLDMLVNGTK